MVARGSIGEKGAAMPRSLKMGERSRRSAVRTGACLMMIVARPALRVRETAKHVARFEVVRRAVRRYHWTTMSFLPPASTFLSSSVRVSRGASSALPLLAFLLCSACASSGGRIEAVDDPTLVADNRRRARRAGSPGGRERSQRRG